MAGLEKDGLVLSKAGTIPPAVPLIAGDRVLFLDSSSNLNMADEFGNITLFATSGNPMTLAAATAETASLNIPEGTTPDYPNNGDIWTTSAGIFVQIEGTTVGPLMAGGGSYIGGSITEGQVAFGDATSNNIDGSSNLTYTDGESLILQGGSCAIQLNDQASRYGPWLLYANTGSFYIYGGENSLVINNNGIYSYGSIYSGGLVNLATYNDISPNDGDIWYDGSNVNVQASGISIPLGYGVTPGTNGSIEELSEDSDYYFETPTLKTYPIVVHSTFDKYISQISIQTVTGSCIVTFNNDGSPFSELTNLFVDDTISYYYPISPTDLPFFAGSRITMTVVGITGATDLQFTFNTTRID